MALYTIADLANAITFLAGAPDDSAVCERRRGYSTLAGQTSRSPPALIEKENKPQSRCAVTPKTKHAIPSISCLVTAFSHDNLIVHVNLAVSNHRAADISSNNRISPKVNDSMEGDGSCALA